MTLTAVCVGIIVLAGVGLVMTGIAWFINPMFNAGSRNEHN
jgi:hypothetical protein